MKKRMLSMLLCAVMLLNMFTSVAVAASADKEGLHPGKKAEEIVEGDVHYSKSIIDDENGNMAIQIDAYTEGKVAPLELVMIVDQSGSMYQTANGNTKEWSASNPGGWMKPEQFLQLNPENVSDPKNVYEGAESPGYYVCLERDNNKEGRLRLVRWNEERSKWEQIKNAYEFDSSWNEISYVYDPLVLSAVFGDLEGKEWDDLSTANNNNKKVYKTMMGATIDSFNALIDEVSGLSNAKVAVVGFASSASEMGLNNAKGGTGVFIPTEDGGSTKFVTANKREPSKNITDEQIQNAFMSTQRRDLIKDAIKRINTSYSNTSTDDGFLLANRLFEQSDIINGTSSKEDTNRVVVLFTDGCPTIASDYSGSSYDVGDTNGKCGYKSAKLRAIEAAYKTKNDYYATVYSYGPSTMKNQDPESNNIKDLSHQDFLNYLSSNYPTANVNASNNLVKGTKTSDEYMGWLADNDHMIEQFQEIGKTIFEASEALNKGTEIRDTVTPYFEIGGNYNGGKITLFEIPYSKAENDFSSDIEEYNLLFHGEIEKEDEPIAGKDGVMLTLKSEREYTQTVVDKDGNEQVVTRKGSQVKVSGFDYQAKSVNRANGTGSMLRLLIPIAPAPEYIGGNYTNTNSADSGLYDGNNTTEPMVRLPEPFVDVVIKDENVLDVNVQAQAGSTVLEEVTYDEILSRVEVELTSKTYSVKLDLTKPDEYFGLEPWQLDFAYVQVKLYNTEVDKDGNVVDGNPDEPGIQSVKADEIKPGESVELRRSHDFIVEVYTWPKLNSDGNKNPAPGEEGAPIEDADFATEVVRVTVFYPTFVFNDLSVYYGEALYVENENWNEANSYMSANKYLKWYTNEQYEALQNPKAKDYSAEKQSYILNPEETFGNEEYGTAVGTPPSVYFLVNPIDSIREHTVSSAAVDEDFYEKYGYVMGKERVGMNVRVYYANENDGAFNPDKLDPEQAMRNAFFLHGTCNDYPNCTHEECKLVKHTSGGHPRSGDDNEDVELMKTYWIPEFYVKPLFCQITIEKESDVPGETYLFNIEKAKPVVNHSNIPQKDENGNYLYTDEYEAYTSVSVTVGSDGKGSTIITELPIGKYRITEDTDWSWRTEDEFKVSGVREDGEQAMVSADKKWVEFELEPFSNKDEATVKFVNENKTDTWLTDFSTLVKNVFSVPKTNSSDKPNEP